MNMKLIGSIRFAIISFTQLKETPFQDANHTHIINNRKLLNLANNINRHPHTFHDIPTHETNLFIIDNERTTKQSVLQYEP